MNVFSVYKTKKPEVFLQLVGMNIGMFQIILEKFRDEIHVYKSEYSAINKGKKSGIIIENQLLMDVLYLRDDATFIKLELQFGISKSYLRNVMNLVK